MPALAARAPFGATYITTGTREARMVWIISRVEDKQPARRVEPDDHGRRALGGGPLQRLRQLAGGDKADRALDIDEEHRTIRRALAGSIAEGHGKHANAQEGDEATPERSPPSIAWEERRPRCPLYHSLVQ